MCDFFAIEERMNVEKTREDREGREEGWEEKLGEKEDEKDKTVETEISCVYFHLSSITPRTLLVKKLPVN